MPMSAKIFVSLAAAGMLSIAAWANAADRPKTHKIDPNDPVVKCQKSCQGEKNNESYESCMLKCSEQGKPQMPAPAVPKK